VLDRARASTQDFVVLLCAERSYGVGQENEIATQAGVPAIRLIPNKGMSRMMLGSFLCGIDLAYSGTLATGIHIEQEQLAKALQEVRRIHFRHLALYRGLSAATLGFGDRLKRLIDDRCGVDYRQLADELGIKHTYLLSLMNEPFNISNPSGRLLMRLAHRLGERVAYLLGESEEQDSLWVQSNESWGKWMEEGEDIDGAIAYRLRKKWRSDYLLARREQLSTASYRNPTKLMKAEDWEREYRKVSKGRSGPGSGQQRLV
jgi:transcriptional regulator with XRE-family HTH domain